ncbi:MAG: TIGR04283 family arsenosugar biosynthesis glycosyltransferase [Acidobacteriota bacterium]|nr:TIGR04283 family arsenosugar biosynthesis glycosyltransferase [Acidobacteriota bacterium]
MSSCDVSVIVPTLNEERVLPDLLRDLQRQTRVRLEVLVADGGSDDGTTALVESFDFARVVACDRGRGRQMNRAAREALGTYLCFLHADTRIPSDGLLGSACRTMTDERRIAGHDRLAGHFPLEFLRADRRKHRVAFRYAEEKMSFDRPHVVNGDQGLLLTPDFFAAVGGFDESLDFLEDQKIAADIRRQGRWVLLPGKMQTSARRFEAAGFHRLYILMSIMQAMYWTGANEFFDRTPGIYRQQQEVGKLLLTPFFREIALMFREDYGVSGTLRLLVGVGRFVRSHSWQMFYLVDICLRPITGPGRYPFLRFHDAVFWKLTNFRVFDGLAAILTVGWFLGVLFPVYTFLDRRELRVDQGRTPA